MKYLGKIQHEKDLVTKEWVESGYAEKTELDSISDDVELINNKISASASPTNKLLSQSEIEEKISLVEANQLFKTSTQGSFGTKAELISASVFYNADGTVATPTKNDVVYVLADEEHDNALTKYVVANVDTTIVWAFVIKVSSVSFTQAQLDAINSGINADKVSSMMRSDADIEDNLTSESTTKALSAKQGKVLSRIVGELANLSTTAKDSIVSAINELKNQFSDYVPKTRTVNGRALSSNISITKSDIGLGNVSNVSALPLSGGTMTGAISMNSKKITSLATPTASTDATNKSYVDSEISKTVYVASTNSSLSPTNITNYITPYNNRCVITDGHIIKNGNTYSMSINFKFTTSMSTWTANAEWLGLFSASTAFKSICPLGLIGTYMDPANGMYGGNMFYGGSSYSTISIWALKTITYSSVSSTGFKMVASWVGQ